MVQIPATPVRLHDYEASHIDEDFSSVPPGDHENELFYNCTFKNVRGAMFRNCNLRNSRFITDKPEEAIGVTFTLECGTFEDVELSPTLFDMALLMLCKSKGNDEKRRQIVKMIGTERVVELLRQLKQVEL